MSNKLFKEILLLMMTLLQEHFGLYIKQQNYIHYYRKMRRMLEMLLLKYYKTLRIMITLFKLQQ